MRLEQGQVAVVTGGASGIGRALVDAFVGRRLDVVVVDVEVAPLEDCVAELSSAGVKVTAAQVDVRDAAAMERLASRVMSEHGRVDVLCNNAGVVTTRAPVWKQTAADWEWTLGVNLVGVANGLRAFVPHLVAAGQGHVVNTASLAGVSTIPGGGNGAYCASKHGVVGLSETLRLELAALCPGVGVTVLCPGPVPTRIHDAGRNRPDDVAASDPAAELPAFDLAMTPVPAEEVAAMVLAAIEERRDYVLTASDVADMAEARAEQLLEQIDRA